MELLLMITPCRQPWDDARWTFSNLQAVQEAAEELLFK
jgi:hypothetical protein